MTTREDLATKLSTVTGISGYGVQPKAPQPGDAWPVWQSSERISMGEVLEEWRILVVLPQDEGRRNLVIDTLPANLLRGMRPELSIRRVELVNISLDNNNVVPGLQAVGTR